MEKNPDFRFNRMRKSGKTEFFEVHIERALITHLITMLFATFFIFVTYMRACTIPRNKHTVPFSRCEGELSDCFPLNKVRINWLFSCLLMPKNREVYCCWNMKIPKQRHIVRDMEEHTTVIGHSGAPSVTTNAQHQVIWRDMKEPTLVVNHLAAPGVATNAQD